MRKSKLVSMASAAAIFAGTLFLSTPARASGEAAPYSCRETVRSYCSWVANNYCSYGATCTYNTRTCDVVNAECWASPI